MTLSKKLHIFSDIHEYWSEEMVTEESDSSWALNAGYPYYDKFLH